MTLPEKIKSIYPSITDDDFSGLNATIHLRNDSDGRGDYIKEWNHPTFERPTDLALESLEN